MAKIQIHIPDPADEKQEAFYDAIYNVELGKVLVIPEGYALIRRGYGVFFLERVPLRPEHSGISIPEAVGEV